MCHRHSFIVTRSGKIHHGFGLTDSHTTIRLLAGLRHDDSSTYAFEWQPPKGWPNADWHDGLTQDTAPIPTWDLKASHLKAMERHVRASYPDIATWEAPDRVSLPATITRIQCDLKVPKGATLTLPALTEVSGDVRADQGATLTLPALTKAGDVRADQGATLTLPALTKAGYVRADQGATLTLPALTKAGDVRAYQGATLTLPALTKAGDVRADQGATLTLPALTEVSGDVRAYQGATLTLPALNNRGE
jgi:ribosomal protein S30